VVLPDPKVSRRHATIAATGGGVLLRDEESLNGTWLNGRRLTAPCTLGDGDRLRIGGCEFVVHESGGGDGFQAHDHLGAEPSPDPVGTQGRTVPAGAGPGR
jgi:pSer/pThr/pTyr-binding forkhead associated (FHA) protein